MPLSNTLSPFKLERCGGGGLEGHDSKQIMFLSPRPCGFTSPYSKSRSIANVPNEVVPLRSGVQLKEFPTENGGCLQATMVSLMLVGKQREIQQ